jgi:serine/threonine protein kinase/tetratricopeptide (TPR) repeat protein
VSDKKTDKLVGKRLGNYVISDLIGEGGMGAVYLAEHPQIGRRVAIKVLDSRLGDHEEVSRRFLAEARAIARIEHPNVIDIYDFGRSLDGQLYYVMELLKGEDLSKIMEKLGAMTAAECWPYLEQICDGLQAAHDHGITHRDLKPENIFIPDSKKRLSIKIIDFGLAKVHDPGFKGPSLTAKGVVMGTPLTISPEQAAGHHDKVGPRTDLYSLGVILYWMLAGEPPFVDATAAVVLAMHIKDELPPLREKKDSVPQGVADLVHRCLAKDPDDRPASAAEIAKTFEMVAGVSKPNATILGVSAPVVEQLAASKRTAPAPEPAKPAIGTRPLGGLAKIASQEVDSPKDELAELEAREIDPPHDELAELEAREVDPPQDELAELEAREIEEPSEEPESPEAPESPAERDLALFKTLPAAPKSRPAPGVDPITDLLGAMAGGVVPEDDDEELEDERDEEPEDAPAPEPEDDDLAASAPLGLPQPDELEDEEAFGASSPVDLEALEVPPEPPAPEIPPGGDPDQEYVSDELPPSPAKKLWKRVTLYGGAAAALLAVVGLVVMMFSLSSDPDLPEETAEQGEDRVVSELASLPGGKDLAALKGTVARELATDPASVNPGDAAKLAASAEGKPKAQVVLARLLLAWGRPRLAAAQARAVLEKDGNITDARLLLGEAIHSGGEPGPAIDEYNKVLAAVPKHARARFRLGEAQLHVGRFAGATSSFTTALEADASLTAPAHSRMGDVHTARKQPAQAVNQYLAALTADDNYAPARVALGFAYARLRRYEQAITALDRAVEQVPRDPMAHFYRGTVLFNLQRTDEALEAYRQAIKLKPGFAEGHYYLGQVHLKRGDPTKARAQFQAAIKAKPDYEAAVLALSKLK